jgi:hypothetical protein
VVKKIGQKARNFESGAALFARDLRFCFSRFRAQKLVDRVEHFVQIADHLIVPESEYSIAAQVQERSAGFIFARFIRVLASVELDDQAVLSRTEIGDVRADWMLATEFDVSHPAASQMSPEDSFGVGLFAAQSSGVLFRKFRRLHGEECRRA